MVHPTSPDIVNKSDSKNDTTHIVIFNYWFLKCSLLLRAERFSIVFVAIYYITYFSLIVAISLPTATASRILFIKNGKNLCIPACLGILPYPAFMFRY